MSGRGSRRTDATGRSSTKCKPRKASVKLPSGQHVQLPRELIESPVFGAISGPALRALFRLCIEHLAHGGNENGRLAVTHSQFVAFGVGHNNVKPVLIELEALGLIEMTQQGGKSFGDTRLPSRFRLTFPPSRNVDQTHEWYSIKTIEEARRRIADRKAEWEASKPEKKPEDEAAKPKRRVA